ncbi:hypothetical protein JTE90_002386 [Oedothorax gibbosus]|uniref:Cyclic AMP-dependent transcription factor ATF-2 n=1 Tax=Oedothorax gibbosus TaxID=931172 RepID=A0AAV6VCD9_9ARAC|nr:hypothetical protein JTE90_002386 [Oedothorax gibbosus]
MYKVLSCIEVFQLERRIKYFFGFNVCRCFCLKMDGDMKKPYECRHRGCPMSFVTKDRLDVHVRTHNLSLTLTPTTPFKTVFVDETPTPTRFLKELEHEVFQELGSVNPFDATFRKANSGNGSSNHFIIPESSSLLSTLSDTEPLNTPSITLPSEPPTPLLLKTNFLKKRNDSNKDNENTLPFATEERSSDGLRSLSAEATFLSSESAFLDGEIKTPSVQTPVIMSIGHSSPLKPNTTGVPTAVVVTRPSANTAQNFSHTQLPVEAEKPSQVKEEPQQAVVQSVCVTPMVQVIIRLPDGQTMPVQFPVQMPGPAPAVTATTVPVQPTNVAPVAIANATNFVPVIESHVQPPSSAKLKLKEILAASLTHRPPGTLNKNPSPKKIPRMKVPTILPNDDVINEFSLSPPVSPIPIRPGHNGRKRRENSNNPDEKRKRSLERNRAAATRCREKKKVWITALEQKAEEMEHINTNLQHEVTQLRNEVAQLKTMLLAHKDCPVTLQQKGMAYAERNAYASIQIINSPEELQRVPNSSVVSPLDSEFMEVELSCAQSCSDTSDTSEASFKER